MLSNVFVTCKMANRTEIECPTQSKKKVNRSNEKLMNPGSYLQGHIASRLSQFLPNARQRSRQLQKLPIVFTKCNNIETIGKFQFDSQWRWNWDQSEEINGRLPTSATSVAVKKKKKTGYPRHSRGNRFSILMSCYCRHSLTMGTKWAHRTYHQCTPNGQMDSFISWCYQHSGVKRCIQCVSLLMKEVIKLILSYHWSWRQVSLVIGIAFGWLSLFDFLIKFRDLN